MRTPPETMARVIGTALLGEAGLGLNAGGLEKMTFGGGIGAALAFWVVGILVALGIYKKPTDPSDGSSQRTLIWYSWKYALIASAVFAGISLLIWVLVSLGVDPV